jgi:hypothetical protein
LNSIDGKENEKDDYDASKEVGRARFYSTEYG